MSSPSPRSDQAEVVGPAERSGGVLPLVWRGLGLARDSAPGLLRCVLAVQLVETIAMVVAVHAVPRVTTALLARPEGAAPDLMALADDTAVLLAAVVVLGICQSVLPALATLLGERLGGSTTARVLAVAAAMELTAFDRPAVLDRLKRVEVGALVRPAQLAVGLGALLSGATGAVAVTVAVLTIEPWLALAGLLAAVPLWWAARREGNALYQSVRGLSRLERRRMHLAGLLTGRAAAAEVRALDLGPHLLARYDELCRRRYADVRAVTAAATRRQLAARAAGAALLFGALLGVVALVQAGRITVTDAVAATAATVAMRARLADASTGVRQLHEAAEFVADHAALGGFGEGGGRSPRPPLVLPPGAPVELRLRRVSFTYPGATAPAVRHVDLAVHTGEVVALVGVNGSGKSTLAALAAGLLAPSAGAVVWNGVDARCFEPASVRAHVSLLLQHPGRYEESLGDNVAFGAVDRPFAAEGVRRALHDAGAHAVLAMAGGDLDSRLGREQDDGLELSGGQWQRVALARAFYRGGPVLILDEPSAPLDPLSERDLVLRLRRSFTSRAVLLVTHRMAAAQVADRVVVLERGSIVEQGHPAELSEAGGAFARMERAQSELWATAGDRSAAPWPRPCPIAPYAAAPEPRRVLRLELARARRR